MKIRVIKPPLAPSFDEFPLTRFKVGVVYAVPAPLATLMIVEGWADPVLEDIEPALPPVTFHITPPAREERRRRSYSDRFLRTRLGLAADRRRRK